MAAGNGAARAEDRSERGRSGTCDLPFDAEVVQADGLPSPQQPLRSFRRPTPVEVNVPLRPTRVDTGRCEGRVRATSQDDSLLSDRSPTLTIAPSTVATAEPKIATSGASCRRRVIRPVRAPRDRAGRRTYTVSLDEDHHHAAAVSAPGNRPGPSQIDVELTNQAARSTIRRCPGPILLAAPVSV